jgi:hypothetical protein
MQKLEIHFRDSEIRTQYYRILENMEELQASKKLSDWDKKFILYTIKKLPWDKLSTMEGHKHEIARIYLRHEWGINGE